MPRAIAVLLASMVAASAAVGCTSQPVLPDQGAEFCDRLEIATGPDGAEAQFGPLDPDRVTGIVTELRGLNEVAPLDISRTTGAAVELFERVQRTPRDEIAALLVENELAIADLSAELTRYATDECGLFLQRAPLPTTESAPLITNE